VAKPPDGTGHARHDVPHDKRDVELSGTQTVPQACWPAGHTHVEFWQTIPGAHMFPQNAQFFGSLVTSTHVAFTPMPHAVPAGQTQWPALQI
jgi:hypothetical protein